MPEWRKSLACVRTHSYFEVAEVQDVEFGAKLASESAEIIWSIVTGSANLDVRLVVAGAKGIPIA